MGDYSDDAIRALKGAERVRLRPSVMFGTDTVDGARHTVNEIFGNSIDEVTVGYGKQIDVVLHTDGSIGIQDYGRGVPMGWNSVENEYNWKLVYDELYAGGKYDEQNYGNSLGLNGLGACAVQYTSEFFQVVSKRDGKVYQMSFEHGEPVSELQVSDAVDSVTGTYTRWKPDIEVFKGVDIPLDWLMKFLEPQAYLNRILVTLLDEATGDYFEFKGNGVEDYLRSIVAPDESKYITNVLSGSFDTSGDEGGTVYKAKAEIALVGVESWGKTIAFHNTADLLHGVHFSAVSKAVFDYFSGVLKQRNLKLEADDIRDKFIVVVATNSNTTSFEGQTKKGVSNYFIYDLVYNSVKSLLQEYDLKVGMKDVIDYFANIVQTRIQLSEYSKSMAKFNKTLTKKVEMPAKFLGCGSKVPEECELFIVEGDSAMEACKAARDGSFQAIIPVRGKTINCLKIKDISGIVKNDLIKDLVTVIGTGIEMEHKLKNVDMFDIDNLRFNKIIFATDADADGWQIRALLLTPFMRLMPQLIEQGHIYVAETPLFELVTSVGSKFAYTVEERIIIEGECKQKGIRIHDVMRSKGLGENTPNMLWDTTMNPETRKLSRVQFTRNDKAWEFFKDLLGDDIGTRRELITQIFKTITMADVDV